MPGRSVTLFLRVFVTVWEIAGPMRRSISLELLSDPVVRVDAIERM